MLNTRECGYILSKIHYYAYKVKYCRIFTQKYTYFPFYYIGRNISKKICVAKTDRILYIKTVKNL